MNSLRQILTACFIITQFVISQSQYSNSIFNINGSMTNLPPLSCGDSISDATTNTTTIKYYKITIEPNHQPIHMTTCCDNTIDVEGSFCDDTSLDTNIYILSERKETIHLLQTSGSIFLGNSQCNNEYKSSIILTNYPEGTYIVGIGGFQQEHGQYHISMHCTPIPHAHPLNGWLFLLPILALSLFILLSRLLDPYLCNLCNCNAESQPKYTNTSRSEDNITVPPNSYTINIDQTAPASKSTNDVVYGETPKALSAAVYNVSNVSTDSDTDDTDASDSHPYPEDKISALLQECIESFKDEDGLDIYQVLAIQGKERIWKYKFEWTSWKSLLLTRLFKSFVFAVIAGLAQTAGLVIAIYELVVRSRMFGNPTFCGGFPSLSNTLMSILLLLIISVYVAIQFKNVQKSGLYKLMQMVRTLHSDHNDKYKKLSKHGIRISWLYLGQFFNYCACLLCAVGSFLIIYQSTSISDMILNAIALFFMLDIDNNFVGVQDYHDCLINLKRFKADYDQDLHSSRKPESDKCACVCCFDLLYRVSRFMNFVAPIGLFLLGFVAPFVPLFCWFN